ncbi:MAG: spondin domain-containing protein [Gammaproteobacteria bacterium]
MKRLMPLAATAAFAVIVAGAAYAQKPPVQPDISVANYLVTIQNLTRGQPFSPGVIVTHRSGTVIWRLAGPTSEGIAAIAQDGNPAVETADLQGAPGIDDVVEMTGPIGRLGGTAPPNSFAHYVVHALPGDQLSVAVMLICTNDGFTGVDSVPLPQQVGQKLSYLASAYDAGVEQNTELSADIVDACGALGPVPLPMDGNNDNLPADGNIIFPHPGIVGGNDLTVDHSLADHAWRNPVARITVRRLP